MKVWIQRSLLLTGAVLIAGLPAAAQRVESALAGIKLYDTGMDVVVRLGSPSDIQEINFGTAAAGGGRPGAGGGPPGAPGSPDGPQISGAAGYAVPPLSSRQAGSMTLDDGSGGGPGGTGPAGGPPRAGGGGTAGAGATQYVRWIFNRPGGQSINVVLNKHNRVVQIEAIGVSNPSIRTSGGIRLGSSMADVIRVYQNPDAYEIGNDYFMVNFLQQSKVAFRFTREHARAPYRVTAIVVSAGKA